MVVVVVAAPGQRVVVVVVAGLVVVVVGVAVAVVIVVVAVAVDSGCIASPRFGRLGAAFKGGESCGGGSPYAGLQMPASQPFWLVGDLPS